MVRLQPNSSNATRCVLTTVLVGDDTNRSRFLDRQHSDRFEKVGSYIGVVSTKRLHDQLTVRKVHYSSPDHNNIRMTIDFGIESGEYLLIRDYSAL